MKALLFAVALLAGCTKAPPTDKSTSAPDPQPGIARRPEPAPAAPNAVVALTSVTLADDCGGTAPAQAPAAVAPSVMPSPAKVARNAPASEAVTTTQEVPGAVAARRRCEQTSMQLSVVAARDAEVHIKSVEVFDETGKSLGVLTASKPTRWATTSSTYAPWDEKVAAGQTAQVSYVLSQAGFVSHYESHDRTYTVKVLASVGGVDEPLQTSVLVVAQPAPVPT